MFNYKLSLDMFENVKKKKDIEIRGVPYTSVYTRYTIDYIAGYLIISSYR